MTIKFEDYISGGYFITKPEDRDAGRNEDLLPEKLLSFSTCICGHLPDQWMFSWMKMGGPEARKYFAAEDGLAPDQAMAVIEWTTKHYPADVDLELFYKLETARDFTNRFLPDNKEQAIYGLGLHRSLTCGFLKECKPHDCQEIDDKEHTNGVYRSIQMCEPIAMGGQVLGFDLLALDPTTYNLDHSWLCNGLERDFNEKLGIIPNKLGLVDDFESALGCANLIVHEIIQAEQGQWLPWLIVQYP